MTNRTFFFLLLSLGYSCSNTKVKQKITVDNSRNSAIVYIFPDSVSTLLNTKIDSQKNYYIELWAKETHYIAFLHSYNTISDDNLFLKSCRKAFINGRYFPVIFDFDNEFGVSETEDELTIIYSKEKSPLVRKKIVIHEGAFFVKFLKRKGIVIDSGYDGLITK